MAETFTDFRVAARALLARDTLSEKEGQFCGGLAHRFAPLSDKQANWLRNRAPAEKADWFKLVGVDLGNGGSGFGDNVAAVAPWKMPDPFDNITTRDLAAVQRAIGDGEWRENAQAADWAGKAVADVLGLDVGLKADKCRIKSMLHQWISNGALAIVTRNDKKSEPRKWVEVGAWVDVS